MIVKLIKTDGTERSLPVTGMEPIRRLIGAEGLDTVNLRDGYVMIVDDVGCRKNLDINVSATALYHAVCRPGTTHKIRGDVVIALDADFG